MSDTAVPDLRPVLTRALDQTGRLIDELSPDQSSEQTPCSEYDVNGLVGHLQAVLRRMTAVLSGEHFSVVPSDLPTSEWSADWTAGREALAPVLADDECLTRTVTVPWGQVSGGAALGMYVGELTVHAWDLARAVDRTDQLDPSLAEMALPPSQQALPPDPRGGDIPFAPVIEVAHDAGPYERLVAWTGRNPAWSA